MESEKLSDNKLYELALDQKKHKEEIRDEVDKNYTSLFTIVITSMPFINNFLNEHHVDKESNFAKVLLILVPLIGMVLSASWIAALKRTCLFLEGIDRFLMSIERKYNKDFISSIEYHLDVNNSPQRVTKQVMWTPYSFFFVFLMAITYFIFDFFLPFKI